MSCGDRFGIEVINSDDSDLSKLRVLKFGYPIHHQPKKKPPPFS